MIIEEEFFDDAHLTDDDTFLVALIKRKENKGIKKQNFCMEKATHTGNCSK